MIRSVVTGALTLTLGMTAVGCSDEPDLGPIEAVVVQGPAGQTHDAPALEVVTYRQTIDGRPQGCFGTRPEGAVDDHPAGSCIAAGRVAGLGTDAFAHTSGPVVKGLVTSEAALVRAHLRDGSTLEMAPYDHPALHAGVFAFTIREGANIMTVDAVDAEGDVLGRYSPS